MRYPTEFHTLDVGGTQRRNRAMRPRAWIATRVLHHLIQVVTGLFDSNAIDFAHLFRCDCWNKNAAIGPELQAHRRIPPTFQYCAPRDFWSHAA
ncbi:MAG TPA: hypothetical protein VKB81_11690 [Nitrospira sp.]|nr:hypothetical protein [Nitrospira sp.]